MSSLCMPLMSDRYIIEFDQIQQYNKCGRVVLTSIALNEIDYDHSFISNFHAEFIFLLLDPFERLFFVPLEFSLLLL